MFINCYFREFIRFTKKIDIRDWGQSKVRCASLYHRGPREVQKLLKVWRFAMAHHGLWDSSFTFCFMNVFLAYLSHRLKVSYCDPMMSIVGRWLEQFPLNNISS